MIICKHCGQPISDKSKICPFCGGNVKIPFYDKTWFHILLVLIIFTGIDYVIRNPDPEPTVSRTPICRERGSLVSEFGWFRRRDR